MMTINYICLQIHPIEMNGDRNRNFLLYFSEKSDNCQCEQSLMGVSFMSSRNALSSAQVKYANLGHGFSNEKVLGLQDPILKLGVYISLYYKLDHALLCYTCKVMSYMVIRNEEQLCQINSLLINQLWDIYNN